MASPAAILRIAASLIGVCLAADAAQPPSGCGI
jgi:hypothetical protein